MFGVAVDCEKGDQCKHTVKEVWFVSHFHLLPRPLSTLPSVSFWFGNGSHVRMFLVWSQLQESGQQLWGRWPEKVLINILQTLSYDM